VKTKGRTGVAVEKELEGGEWDLEKEEKRIPVLA
jgi:hypothetical protein